MIGDTFVGWVPFFLPSSDLYYLYLYLLDLFCLLLLFVLTTGNCSLGRKQKVGGELMSKFLGFRGILGLAGHIRPLFLPEGVF